MSATISITADDVFTALGAFIASVLPNGTPVVQGLGNRVAMPTGAFVAMTSLYENRIATNTDSYDPDPLNPVAMYAQQHIQLTVQIDCFGPLSQDWAGILTTLLRDDFGVQALAPNVAPLYADDPQQMPLIDGEAQYEKRWTITAVLQYNPAVTVPMQFANTLEVALVNVDETYPP